jgi:predicted TIM-barrel fold metal-dependent hydrolase
MMTHAHALAGVDELGLDEDTRRDFLHGNAERVFRFAQPERNGR